MSEGADPRVLLAAERTLLAWVRTALAMMGFGFVVARFGMFLREVGLGGRPAGKELDHALWIGVALVLLATCSCLIATQRYVALRRRLERNEPYVARTWSLEVVVGVLMALLGFGMILYLVFSQGSADPLRAG